MTYSTRKTVERERREMETEETKRDVEDISVEEITFN